MNKPSEKPPRSLFERFVSAIAGVTKPEVDILEARRKVEPRVRRGPKPKKPAV